MSETLGTLEELPQEYRDALTAAGGAPRGHRARSERVLNACSCATVKLASGRPAAVSCEACAMRGRVIRSVG